MRVGAPVAVSLATDLAPLDSRDEPIRFTRGWHPLAALVPSTRSSRRFGVDDLTICASPNGSTASTAVWGERIEERRDQ